MSKRFGRNQRRQMREKIADQQIRNDAQRETIVRIHGNEQTLIDGLDLALHVMARAGWKEDSDAVRSVRAAFSKLRGHHRGSMQ